MARDMVPLQARSCSSLAGAIVSEMQTSLSLQPYNLCYNPFSTATWNSQIKDIVCIPRANRIGEKHFSSWIQFLPACLPFKLSGSPKSINKPLGQLDWKLTWSNFRKLIPPVVAALLSHSTSASGNKWFVWVILAKLGEIVLNFLHNFSVPNCINSWRWNNTVVGLLDRIIIIPNGPCDTSLPFIDPIIIIPNGPCGTSLPFQHLFKFIKVKWLCSTPQLAGNKEKSSSQHLISSVGLWAKQWPEILTPHKIHPQFVRLPAESSLAISPERSHVTPQKWVTRTALKAPFLNPQTRTGLQRKSWRSTGVLFGFTVSNDKTI